MAQVLARKYRPKSFDDLIGQEAIAKTLSLALDLNKLSYAYLFSGIRGGGKTSTARIFAKALLCEKGPNSKPCQECSQCIMANEGRHIDIIELDAASNRGIDDIKELIEQTKYKPSIGRFKIFIIDEVHMLTTQAFNALLKTLEEPPEFVKFILATTDPLKLPATILSRVQHFRFKKIPTKIVKNHLEFILNKENIDYEDNAIEIIARSGEGSIRDSLTLLDQAIVYANGKITANIVTSMLGVVETKILEELMNAIINKNKNEVLNFIEDFKDYESEMIIDELSIYLKESLFNNQTKIPLLLIDRFFRIISQAKNLLSIGSESEFVLSLTLFKMIEAVNILDIDDAIEKLQKEICNTNYSLQNNTTYHSDKKREEEMKESLSSQKTIVKDNLSNNNLKFKKLIERIYDRNYELGEVFEKCVKFEKFENSILLLSSSANEEERLILRNGWNVIKLFIQELFGIDIKIKVAQKKSKKLEKEEKIDNFIQKNSCIMPEGDKESSIDKDPNRILEEPMIKDFIEKLNPKRVIVKSKT